MAERKVSSLDRDQLHRVSVEEDMKVYRFVRVSSTDDPKLIDDFQSDRSRGKKPIGRSSRIPELRDGISVFRSLETARRRWADLATRARRKDPTARMRVGDYVACVGLCPGDDFAFEDLGDPDGHITAWGAAHALAGAVIDITNASG